jgi:hypothetical protein
MISRLSRILLFVAGGCFVVAFFLPALYLTGQDNTAGQKTSMVGLAAFFDGFWALFDRQYAWLANPLAGLAVVGLLSRRGRRGVAFGLALAALLIAQHTWVVVGHTIWGDEGGVTKYLVTSLGVGVYLWSLSFLLLAVASLVRRAAGSDF